MESIGQKKKPCEEEKIFTPKMALQKRCRMIRLTVQNFLNIYEK